MSGFSCTLTLMYILYYIEHSHSSLSYQGHNSIGILIPYYNNIG
jgi:hypothetical protein